MSVQSGEPDEKVGIEKLFEKRSDWPPIFGEHVGAWAMFLVGVPIIFILVGSNYGGLSTQVWDSSGERVSLFTFMFGQLVRGFGVGLIGGFAGFVLVFGIYLFARHPDYVLAGFGLLIVFVVVSPSLGPYAVGLVSILGFLIGLRFAIAHFFPWRRGRRRTTLGSAEWADFEHIEQGELLGSGGLRLGEIQDERSKDKNAKALLRYAGPRHLLTVAPTRSGKGVSAIIPNLLTYPGSILVVDPKGENAITTMQARAKMGQACYVLDPWRIATSVFENCEPAYFNPLDWLDPNDPDLNENAMMIADSLVVKGEGSQTQFWDEESKALLMGLILFVATNEKERDKRHLGRVRELLTLNPEDERGLFQLMYESPNPVVSAAGARCMQKEARLLSNVMATAQSHTHFLDSPRIRESLSKSTFKFEDLKTKPASVFLVLPADRLNTFGRWLRILVQQAITVNARNILEPPEHPILFMLDELPALGHLTTVEQAYSLMAGFGMQLWGITQDLSQLEKVYGKGWQTFVANSGVLQYFGSRDVMTAEYFSKLCGVTTVETLSTAISRAFTNSTGGPGGGSSSTTSSTGNTSGEQQRNLALPDELMTMLSTRQLLIVENLNPIQANKTIWHKDTVLKPLGFDLHEYRRKHREAAKAAEKAAANAKQARPQEAPTRRPPDSTGTLISTASKRAEAAAAKPTTDPKAAEPRSDFADLLRKIEAATAASATPPAAPKQAAAPPATTPPRPGVDPDALKKLMAERLGAPRRPTILPPRMPRPDPKKEDGQE